MADLLDLLVDNSEPQFKKTGGSFASAIKKTSSMFGGDKPPTDSPYSNPIQTGSSIDPIADKKAIGIDNDISAFNKEEKVYSNTGSDFYTPTIDFSVSSSFNP
jgi:hypothetical protein